MPYVSNEYLSALMSERDLYKAQLAREAREMKTSELQGAALDWAVAKALSAPIGKPVICKDCRFFEERSGPDGGLYYCSHIEWQEIEFWGKAISPAYDVHPSCQLKDTAALPYSTDWAEGGPIIEREMIWLGSDGIGGFDARIYEPDEEPWQEFGPTMLIAAMRCYVASKLGDTVEIPEELK